MLPAGLSCGPTVRRGSDNCYCQDRVFLNEYIYVYIGIRILRLRDLNTLYSTPRRCPGYNLPGIDLLYRNIALYARRRRRGGKKKKMGKKTPGVH